MSDYYRCTFCHEWIQEVERETHEATHLELLPDGQHRDHVTLPEEQRYEGPLDDVPQWYVHDLCGAVTGMPEEIVRSYLANPFLYGTDTFCAGCGDYFREDQFRWTETNEYVADYVVRLRREHVRSHPYLTIEPDAVRALSGLMRSQLRWSPRIWLRRLADRSATKENAMLRLEHDCANDALIYVVDFEYDPRRDCRRRFGELRVVINLFEHGGCFNGMTIGHDQGGFSWNRA